ncbi:MAG: hypothetical protein C4521_07585 [Actinobacteria bacterium]|nr:MAG: hypothetical protein C4521_07585 [Actinomycetota bacterium]
MTIQVTSTGDKVRVSSPYHPDFPARAKMLGGRWDPEAREWTFDLRDENRVRALCREVYGTDGSGEVDLVTLRVSLDDLRDDRQVWVAGRCVAERRSRDSAVRLGDGVILLSGGFPWRGGSSKYPGLKPYTNTVLEVRDVPRPAAEAAVREYGHAVVIVSDEVIV